MTWGFANFIHRTYGHNELVRLAQEASKSEMFIRNVCNNNCCEK